MPAAGIIFKPTAAEPKHKRVGFFWPVPQRYEV